MKNTHLIILTFVFMQISCQSVSEKSETGQSNNEYKLIVLDPGHFHADLLQKRKLANISDTVYVYAPKGFELNQYLERIDLYNQCEEFPTSWIECVYSEDDFLECMLREKKGDVVVIAGNNQKKTDYIFQSVKAGLNVLSDKPMAINSENFSLLTDAFREAQRKGALLYDIMTERYDVLNEIERIIIEDDDLFGTLEKGTYEHPAVKLESVHHFYKTVSGKPLIRAPWYYDVEQQGEGIVDVTTHLIDIVNWKCFPETVLNYKRDVEILDASHYTTDITLDQFRRSTKMTNFPEYLNKYISDSLLKVYSNGKIQYKIKDVNVAISVLWNYEALSGSGDTFSSTIRGTKAFCQILQDKKQGSVPQLYVGSIKKVDDVDFSSKIDALMQKLQLIYPYVNAVKEGEKYRIDVPAEKRVGHEEHFSKVAEKYFNYVKEEKMPEWEIAFMLTKYYITTQALKMAKSAK